MAKIVFIMNVGLAKGWAECIAVQKSDVVPAVGTIVSFQDGYAPVQDVWYDLVRNHYCVYLGEKNENGEPMCDMRNWSAAEAAKFLRKSGFKVKIH